MWWNSLQSWREQQDGASSSENMGRENKKKGLPTVWRCSLDLWISSMGWMSSWWRACGSGTEKRLGRQTLRWVVVTDPLVMVKKWTEISLNLRVFLVTPPGSHGELDPTAAGWVTMEHNQSVRFLSILRGSFSIQVVYGSDQVCQASVLGQSVQGRPSSSSRAFTERLIQCPFWQGFKT